MSSYRTPAGAPNRITARFAALRAEGRGALITFIEAFDPDRATSEALLQGLPGAGADLVELGVPFTDPMADGPTIQRAGQRALKAGATLPGTLELVRGFRAKDGTTPVVLMGYYNPILAHGPERFCSDAAEAGVDGLIVVDLPPEEADELTAHTVPNRLELIRLVAPTTDETRLPFVLAGSGGFIYYVSITGITGTRSTTEAQLAEAIPRIRRATDLPIAVGFGVRTPEQAAMAVRIADAAVVGSALLDTLAADLDESGRARPGTVEKVLDQVRALAAGVRGARREAA
ncbi:tryptophan synthase subunit alpha [Elioraea tepida]|uniref:Tryptophan synthase alpha chain n=1 Tax=Elioraea tepida TaxID=2843330 RepID=A0A975U4C0_9PROT|nr:tryptophan synthase subunit alpha [Elioraea tepida]QXM25737.1 tryptophan synthase subunit alpha [Elioraea tepida]